MAIQDGKYHKSIENMLFSWASHHRLPDQAQAWDDVLPN